MPKRLSRGDYASLRNTVAANINMHMTRNGLTPARVQEAALKLVMSGAQEKGITMQDLYHYRQCHSIPKGAKLRCLAAILKCHPDDLVPRQFQSDRVVVARKFNAVRDKDRIAVEELDGGEAVLIVHMRARAEVAFELARKLVKVSNYEETKRQFPDWSHEQIMYHLAPRSAEQTHEEMNATRAANGLAPIPQQ